LWAVPKGFSFDPKDKRLAVRTEDHPMEYTHFEGVIPKGEYGAGTMKIWDRGTFELVVESDMDRAVEIGEIKVVLRGRKLRGEWHIVKTKRAPNSWLLFKSKDRYAGKGRDSVLGISLDVAVRAAMPERVEFMRVEGERAPFSNLDKVYWPAEAYTKGDLLAYYDQVAEYLVPYMVDRPVHMLRYPDGIDGKFFYQRQAPEHLPEWFETVRIQSSQKEEDHHQMVCTGRDSLLTLANLGGIDLHPWLSRRGSLDSPDFALIDLDPKGAPFEHVVRIARVVGRIPRGIGLTPTARTCYPPSKRCRTTCADYHI
jgi:bifunctional non-homologous end joining protein LigD